MTLENATSFFAWDVSSFLALFLGIAFLLVVIDKLFFDKTPSSSKKSVFSKLIYFVCFLKFEKSEKYENRAKIVRWSAEFYPVLLLVFLLRGFVIEPFRIPSNSMMPTLLTGDFIVVNKFNYGVRLPVLNAKIVDVSSPKRGDVIVFRYPNYEKSPTYKGADFIKRVIGLPGDEIIYNHDQLHINGKAIEYQDFEAYQGVESGKAMTGFRHKRELLQPNSHDILLNPTRVSRPVQVKIPAGHYFVMGDNRSRSSDSRFWGFVPESYIIGQAVGIWMHWDESFKPERIGGFD